MVNKIKIYKQVKCSKINLHMTGVLNIKYIRKKNYNKNVRNLNIINKMSGLVRKS